MAVDALAAEIAGIKDAAAGRHRRDPHSRRTRVSRARAPHPRGPRDRPAHPWRADSARGGQARRL